MGLASAVAVPLQFVQTAILARLLDAAEFGLMGMAMLAVSLFDLSTDMGLGSAVIHDQDASQRRLSAAFWGLQFQGIVVFAALLAGTPLVAGFFEEPALVPLLHLACLSIVIRTPGQLYESLLERNLDFRKVAIFETSASLAGALCAIFGALGGLGVYSLVLGQLVRLGTKSLLLFVNGVRTWRPSLRADWRALPGYYRYGAYLVGHRYLNFAGKNVDKALIGKLLGADALGFYTIAWNLVERPVGMINPAITRVCFPLLARVRDDSMRMRDIYLQAVETIAFLNFPVYLGMFAVAGPLMHFYLGPGWDLSTELLRILAFVGCVRCLVNPIGSLLMATGHTRAAFLMDVALLPAYVLTIWVSASHGLAWVAVALLLTDLLVLLPCESLFRSSSSGIEAWAVVRRAMPLFLAASLMGLLVKGMEAPLTQSLGSWSLLPLVLIGVGAYGLAVRFARPGYLTTVGARLRPPRQPLEHGQ